MSPISFEKKSLHSSKTDFDGAMLTDDGCSGRNILSLLLEKGERLKDDMVLSQIQDTSR